MLTRMGVSIASGASEALHPYAKAALLASAWTFPDVRLVLYQALPTYNNKKRAASTLQTSMNHRIDCDPNSTE